MKPQLARIERRLLEIEEMLTHPEVMADGNQFAKLSRERASIEQTVSMYRELLKLEKQAEEAHLLYEESSGEMKNLAFDEEKLLQKQITSLEKELLIRLLPENPNDSRSIFLEIRAGAGGDEASLFAAELFRTYSRYAEKRGWKVSIASLSESGPGGFKEVIAHVEGAGVYGVLKYESGVHRVQRIPQTESQGRVHTSTVTVAILPEPEELDEISIQPSDLRIDTYRAGGAGGQHVNRTDSAVRITHIPSGIVVACQDERSQGKNRSRAMQILAARLHEIAEREKESALSEERKQQVGRGDRSERIRTYNFPQSRITDHRINYTLHSVEAFMAGDIQSMLDSLKQYDLAEAARIYTEQNC